MNRYIKKTAIGVMALTLMLGTVELIPNDTIYATEIEGDVAVNPWKDLFTQEQETGNLTIEETTDKKDETTKETVSSDEVSSLKKSLNTKVVSAKKATKKAKKAKILLKKVNKATGYQVKYSTSKKFKKYTTKKYKKNKFTIKKLKAGKKYYIKARAYAKVNGKTVYGKWSKKKAIKVKK